MTALFEWAKTVQALVCATTWSTHLRYNDVNLCPHLRKLIFTIASGNLAILTDKIIFWEYEVVGIVNRTSHRYARALPYVLSTRWSALNESEITSSRNLVLTQSTRIQRFRVRSYRTQECHISTKLSNRQCFHQAVSSENVAPRKVSRTEYTELQSFMRETVFA